MYILRDPPDLPAFSPVPCWTCAADCAPAARWKTKQCGILRLTTEEPSDAQRQRAGRCDLLHLSWTLSFAADVDPHGLIFKVLHVCNLRICYRLDIWAIPSVTWWCRYVISVFKLKYCLCPKYTHFRFIKVWYMPSHGSSLRARKKVHRKALNLVCPHFKLRLTNQTN